MDSIIGIGPIFGYSSVLIKSKPMLIPTALCSTYNDVGGGGGGGGGGGRHKLFGILIKVRVDGLAVTTSHAHDKLLGFRPCPTVN